jgi:hypothetical protein
LQNLSGSRHAGVACQATLTARVAREDRGKTVSVETEDPKVAEMENLVCAMTAIWGYARGLLTKEETEKLLGVFEVKNEDGDPASVRDFAGTMNRLAIPLKEYARSL